MKKKKTERATIVNLQGSGVNLSTGISVASGNITSTTFNTNSYGEKILIDTIVNDDSIELVYKAYPIITYTFHFGNQPVPRVWKDIYKCVKGKLQIAETIEGTYVEARDESYEF